MTDQSRTVAAIIVAAGQGVRMGTAGRKQYIVLGSRPVLAHTLSAFEKCSAVDEMFLVIPVGDDSFCREHIVNRLRATKPIHLVSGGSTRQESVLNGLKATAGAFDLVAIHDGVRPLIAVESIKESIETAEKYGGCILAVEAFDTIKSVDEKDLVIRTLDRRGLRLAQTPQAFRFDLILKAHMAAQEDVYIGTDDAELAEKYGVAVKVIPGDPYNIKITRQEDLKIAEALLARKIHEE